MISQKDLSTGKGTVTTL